MVKMYYRILAVLISLLMVIAIFGGCMKEDDGQSATGTVVKTSVSTAAKSSSSVSGTAKKTSVAQSATSSTAKSSPVNEGSSVSTDTSDMDNQTDNTETASDITETDYETLPEEKTYDLKGRIIRIIAHAQSLVVDENGTTDELKLKYKLLKEAEKKFNCTFTFEVAAGQSSYVKPITAAVLAGVDSWDMFRMQITSQSGLEKNNIILPVSDYYDFNQPYMQYPWLHHAFGIINKEKIYAFFNCTPYSLPAVWYDKGIMEREGITNIQELGRAGRWNWDAFLDVAIRTTKDFDGDGLVDQWGCGSNSFRELAGYFLHSNMAPMAKWSENEGKFVFALDDIRAIRALEFVSDLYHIHKVTPNKNTTSDFVNGKIAMYFYPSWWGSTLIEQYKRTGVEIELIPSGPDNPGNTYMRELAAHLFFYPCNIKDPEAVVQATAYWQIIWDPARNDYMDYNAILNSEKMRRFDTEENRARYIEIMQYKFVSCPIALFGSAKETVQKMILDGIAKERISPISLITSAKDVVQANIDDVVSGQ